MNMRFRIYYLTPYVRMYVCRCFGKSLEMLRHKVIATNIQRIKVQEISSSTIVNTPTTHTNSNSNGQTNGRANKTQSNISTSTGSAVGPLDENNDIDFNYFDDNSNNNAATSNNNSNNVKSRSSNNGNNNNNNSNNNAATSNNNNSNNVKSRSSNNGNNNNNNSGGNTHKGPRSFECEVRGAMVGHTCIPGDMVNIVGVVKTISVSHCF